MAVDHMQWNEPDADNGAMLQRLNRKITENIVVERKTSQDSALAVNCGLRVPTTSNRARVLPNPRSRF
ncbi:hypothetical protein VNO77_34435 [Canavalia gladiata]|uniref:Uncharacterized protein n=1 Tax=Canavalia gladiata TaxID=3824 RepID=A0AAN9KGJ0_CANGL